MKILPIDEYIKDGFKAQLMRQFRCPALYVTSPDKLRNLKALQGNETPSYPYMFLAIQSATPNTDSYVTHRLSRQGIPVTLSTDNNKFHTARLLPVRFELEISYVTNKHKGDDTDSVDGFTRRWLFARRIGSMNFNVDYGLSSVAISYILGENISIPARENPTETESVYMLSTTATILGYVSEPELGSRGRINEVILTQEPEALSSNKQFFKFDEAD
jgi:hypothetical protein